MAYKPWTTADQQTVSELKPLARAEYCRQRGKKLRSRPAAQEYNVLCSKHLRKRMGHPWLAAGVSRATWRSWCLPVLDVSGVAYFDQVFYRRVQSRPSGTTPAPALISLDVDNRLSEKNCVACTYFIARPYTFCLLPNSRPRVLYPLTLKTLLGSVGNSSLYKAVKLETSPRLNPPPVANRPRPHSKTKRM